MKTSRWCAALMLAGALAIPPAVHGQTNQAHNSGPPAYMVASFTGQHLGRFPAANCAQYPQSVLGVVDFAETTPPDAPAGFGSFDLQVNAGCVTPFFQALFAREPLTVVTTFVSGDGTPAMTYTMKNVQLARVALATTNARGALPAVLTLSFATPNVEVAAGGGSSAVSAPSALSGSSRTAALRPLQVSALAAKRPRAPRFHLALQRGLEVPSLHISGALAASAPTAAPTGVGAGWLGGALRGDAERGLTYSMNLTAAPPQPLEANNVRITDVALDASYGIDAGSHMPSGALQLSLPPLLATSDVATTVALGNAGRAHGALTHAVLVVSNFQGTPGITITLHGGRFLSYQLAASASSNLPPIQTLQLGLDGVTITDVGSGKTASSQP